MNARLFAGLLFVGVILLVGIATQESAPGYMDADYYYANGLRIANEGSWTEPFIWNYLDNPQGLPHPAFTYWMPLAGVVSAIGIKLSGWDNFWSARIGFLLIAACLAPLTAYLAFTFTQHRWAALLAGVIALFSGFYFAYLPTTETFGIYMLLGSVFFLLVRKLQLDINPYDSTSDSVNSKKSGFLVANRNSPMWVYISIGVIVGLMYLTRSDGLIWLGMGLVAIFLQWSAGKKNHPREGKQKSRGGGVWLPLGLFLTGFLIIISPWLIRNIFSFGSIIAPGSGKVLWLTNYDDLYAYPSSNLTFNRWLSSGIGNILHARGWASGLNTLTAIAVQGEIFLMPLIAAGMWSQRKDWRVLVASGGWLVIYLIMTLVFPFQGARGGFFHAGAGFQPLFWSLVPAGLLAFINWGTRKRNWESQRALSVFIAGIFGLVIIVTGFVTWRRINHTNLSAPAWGRAELAYQEVEIFLQDIAVPSEAIVMVNNPPGYYAMTGRQAIVIPDGDLATSLHAGEDFQASYLILEENHPDGLVEIYQHPGDYPGLQYLGAVKQMHIYMIEQ